MNVAPFATFKLALNQQSPAENLNHAFGFADPQILMNRFYGVGILC